MKFISIIGFDRSGTTFLGNYLDHLHDKIFYAGEIDKGVKHYFNGAIKECTCGKSFTECEVWGNILPYLKKDDLDLEFICNKIHSLTGAEIIVDSSKQKKFPEKFQNIFGSNHNTVFVKRNPKAVCLSRLNQRKRRIKKGSHPKPHLAKQYRLMMAYDCLEWNEYNLWAEKFIRSENNVVKLTYDNFKNDLPSHLVQLVKKLVESENLDMKPDMSHVIWGNKGRMNFNKEITINNRWEVDLNRFEKGMIDFLTFPVRYLKNYIFK